MAGPAGLFDETGLAAGWFDETADASGWFDGDQLEAAAAAGPSSDRSSGTAFSTRTVRGRQLRKAEWVAAMAPAPAVPGVVPAAAWFTPPRSRRRATAREIVEAPPLEWKYIAPTVAAILKPERPKVVAFRRTRIQTPPLVIIPAAPPTGPPPPAWLAAAVRRVSQHRRRLRLADQPAYPATPAAESPDRASGAAFETKRQRGRRFIEAPDVIGVGAATQPVVTPYLEPAQALRRRETRRERIAPVIAPVFPATPAAPTAQGFPGWRAPVTLRAEPHRKAIQRLDQPAYPPTPPATSAAEITAVVGRAVKRRKGRAGLFLGAGGDVLSIPTPSNTPAVYPSFVPTGFNRRRETTRRLIVVLQAPVFPATAAPEASPDRASGEAFSTRRQRGRRLLRQPDIIGVDAATPGTANAPESAYRPPRIHRIERRRKLQPAAPQITYPATPAPPAVSIAAIIPSRSIRRKARPGIFLGSGVTVDGYTTSTAQPEAAWRQAKAIPRKATTRRHLTEPQQLERPATPPVPPQPAPAWRQAVAKYSRGLGRRLIPADVQLEHPATPPAVPGLEEWIIRARRRGRR